MLLRLYSRTAAAEKGAKERIDRRLDFTFIFIGTRVEMRGTATRLIEDANRIADDTSSSASNYRSLEEPIAF